MRVAELMTTKVFTVEPHDLIDRVFFLIHYEKIRHLPVVEKGKLVGIVSDRDLYKALGPKSNSNAVEACKDSTQLHVVTQKVVHIMHRGVYTVTPETPASEAAAMMAEHRVGALPVVEKDKLVGILSATDILRVFAKLERAHEKLEQQIKEGAAHG
ncbi:CBS domain-containing protein [Methylomonas sp. EFPC1]|uniref:CBS domain-containing protein n=1 Tax=Methylomonas sp. EFPC1 TaxID=2812647 RepID=UPI001966EC36|nr:CBS domain-containing protein [Methylomonas sp. EFPC1]QSB01751.1 CBS domain-containing protein [Methylomonas sp. EFPC1]